MPALRSSRAEVAVIADADVWTDGLERGLRALTCGMADWVVPHRRVLRLDRAASDDLIAGEPLRHDLARKPYEGKLGGGLVIATREALLEVPMDARFVGWGGEDDALGYALQTMLGPCWRGDADLIHCWHPPSPRAHRGRFETKANGDLEREYHLANGNPDKMRELLKGAA